MVLLAVFAHPDDESYGPGATLARYAAAGHAVHLLTFTRGGAGSMGICKTMEPGAVAEMRAGELTCAGRALGLTGLTILDFPDKGLAGVPPRQGIDTILSVAGDLRPDTIMTFHADGISGHPDHTAVSAWVSAAHAEMTERPVAEPLDDLLK